MTTLSRRTILKSAITGAAAASVPSLAGAMATSSLRSSSRSSVDDLKVTPRKGRIKQSVSRWCYQKIEPATASSAAWATPAAEIFRTP